MKKLLFLLLLVPSLAIAGEPCKGTTKKGQPCKSVIVSKNGYCRMHNPNANFCGAKTSKGTCKQVVKQGQKCRFHK